MTLTIESAQLKPNRLPLIPTYPPFRQWKREALDTALQDQPLSIYVHIPFCTQRCAFCYYKTVDLKRGKTRSRKIRERALSRIQTCR
jgi:oxygen-independent coproporphyrinogen-3 oxidase